MSNTVNHILKSYLRKLTSLVSSNRSLLLLKASGSQVMDLHEFNHLTVRNAFEIIESLIARKAKAVCPVLDSRMETANEISLKLKRLQRTVKFLFEEKGTHDLHVGWPVARGKFTDGTPVRAPLLFFPIELHVENGNWVVSLRKEASLSFNKSFLLAYFHYNNLKADDELLETSFEDADTDSTVFRTQLYQLLRDKVELNFNTEIFSDSIRKFEEFNRDQFEKAHHNGALKLFHEAVLGIFPQADSQLVTDYIQLIGENRYATLEDFFVTKMPAETGPVIQQPAVVNLAVKEEKVFAPFNLDAWQEHALKCVKLGNSLVVQGPPGTGKSQLIANLIADSMASGKRTLLVCQKRVALDVVYDRLASAGLSAFTGLVHDFRDDRKPIYEKIAAQIERVEEYKARNRSVDSIQTERRFFQVCRTIDQLSEELEDFRKALFAETECGLSVKELYLTSDPWATKIPLRQEYRQFNFQSLTGFLSKLKAFVSYAKKMETNEYPWRNRKSFAGYQLADRDTIEGAVRDVKEFQEQLGQRLEGLLNYTLSFEEAEALWGRKALADELMGLLADEAVFTFFKAMVNEKDEATSLLWLQNMERVCMNCFEGTGPEASLTGEQIGRCQLALQQRLDARRNLIRLIRWELFSEHKFFLKRILIANRLPYTKRGLQILEERLDNRLNLEHHLTSLKNKKWLIGLPRDYDSRKFKKWFEKQVLAVRAKLLFTELREISKTVNPGLFTRDEFMRLLWSIFDTLEEIPGRKNNWLHYLTQYQVTALSQQPGLWFNLVQQLRIDFDSICEFDCIKESLAIHETDIINRIYDEIKTWDETKVLQVFQNSLRLAWIDHIEAKHPVLRSVSTLRMQQLAQQLMQAIVEKQKLSSEILLLRARERVYERVEYNRLNNRVTYRDLLHQVTKKKKIWPVRKLINEFDDELFNLIPCWMASPESVSALFPLKEIFDLVIFDEASQCFAERGLPAMCRGRQLVVAGDRQQLKPFDLYQVRFQDDDETEELEANSLLDLSDRYLPTVYLHGHYRSQLAELIEFSNQKFYNGKLRLLPDRKLMSAKNPAIEYLKIDGLWKDKANLPEAEAVVEKILDLIHHHPDYSIGVVTFNAPQQELILDKLDEARVSGKRLPESLFIKNIENVQGDERDIIIFSTAYAADKTGKLNMQFGSLNVAGGENRLNVAITRARQKVIVITSIWPEELKLQGIKNEGPKLLRAYLEFARQVSSAEYTQAVHQPVNHQSDWYLASAVLSGYTKPEKGVMNLIQSNLPAADLILQKDGTPKGILVTDDETYEQMYTVKDGYVYSPMLLEQKSWPWQRMYSRNWWLNREQEQQELTKYMYQLTQADAE